MAARKTRLLRISAKPEKGFWRCGVKHTQAAVDHPINRFTKEQIDTLKAEPMLRVEEVDVPDEETKETPAS